MRVAFTDDVGNDESLTSQATVAVAAAPEPLTGRLKVSAPATHDGSVESTFEIEFSEGVELSYATLRDHAFNVTGGSVEKAQRTDQPSNIPWLITVKPHVTGDAAGGRDHPTPGHHGLRRPGGHLHRRRQEVVQLAGLHRQWSGPVG